ncbi:MAG TPA: GMP synthase [Deltaproteobacteria bacterium]|nr:GMP synthase [Deltaproteobacteria bacterium]
MRKLLVCQHVAHELLGTLDPMVRAQGFRVRYVNFGRNPDEQPNLEGYAGLILLGGPMNVGQADTHPHIHTEKALVRRALELQIPVLGICLGAQIIAAELGANVGPARQKEIGWSDISLTEAGRQDVLLRHFRETERIFQWHSDTFSLPSGATLLARGDECENQAFRFGDRIYGLQFHLEVDQPMIERWLRIPDLLGEIADLENDLCPERILEETTRQISRTQDLAQKTFSDLLRIFDPTERGRVLPTS